MRTSEIIKNLQELKERYSHTDFPFEYYFGLASRLRTTKHIYNISEKINKEDRAALKELEEGTPQYSRRESLLLSDRVQQNLRLNQIEQMKQEIQVLTDKLNEIIRGEGN